MSRGSLNLLWSLLLVVITYLAVVCGQNPDHSGTTRNIETIFLGRCFDYRQLQSNKFLLKADVGCDNLWDSFTKAFSYQPPCYVTMKSYQPFLNASKQDLPADKVLFWSGVYDVAHEYAGTKKMVTLEDTLMGYLVNQLTWCGQSIDPGLNYTRCPSWTDCPLEASESFWAGASTTFASQAKGKVTLILDGSNPSKPAYRRTSFFGKYELPNLNQELVTGVDVMVVHNLQTGTIVDSCDSVSIQQLSSDLQARGFTMECQDNPRTILYLLCAGDPTSRECQAVSRHIDGLIPTQEIPHTRNFNQKPHDLF